MKSVEGLLLIQDSSCEYPLHGEKSMSFHFTYVREHCSLLILVLVVIVARFSYFVRSTSQSSLCFSLKFEPQTLT